MSAFDVGVRLAVVAALLLGLGAVRFLDRPVGAWRHRVRTRLLLGVPWGTLVVSLFVLGVYLVLQSGWDHWYDPTVLPFVSWSYLYPVGLLTAPFTHKGAGHLTGNLVGTLALAPVAEYAWSHFPTERGETTFASWRTNPYVRAFVLFPLGVLAVGLATSVFHWGPVIGFSGVVYAFAGFALVRYPLLTVVALTARGTIDLVYDALRSPVVLAEAGPSYYFPSWANIAVEAHLFGLLLGAVIATVVVVARGERPSGLRLWVGGAVAGTSLSAWALWWYRGGTEYVLHRGLGLVLVLTLATVVLAAVHASNRELALGVDRRTVAVVLLVLPLVTMAFVAVPVNLTTVADGSVDGTAVDVRGYTVTYDEGVQNQKVPALNFSVFGEDTRVESSGVIVVNEDRELWTVSVTASELAFYGTVGVDVGGLGWRETVWVQRRGWKAVGGGTAYHVRMKPPDGDYRLAYQSGGATARPVIAGQNVSVVPDGREFRIELTHGNRTVGTAPVPPRGGNVTIGGIRFVRQERHVVATFEGTRVRVLKRETYE